MKLYIVRHGETTWNALHKVQGSADIPLAEKGIQLASARIPFLYIGGNLTSIKRER